MKPKLDSSLAAMRELFGSIAKMTSRLMAMMFVVPLLWILIGLFFVSPLAGLLELALCFFVLCVILGIRAVRRRETKNPQKGDGKEEE